MMKRKLYLTIFILSVTAVLAVVNVNLAKIDSFPNSLTLKNREAMANGNGENNGGTITGTVTANNTTLNATLKYEMKNINGRTISVAVGCQYKFKSTCTYTVSASFTF